MHTVPISNGKRSVSLARSHRLRVRVARANTVLKQTKWACKAQIPRQTPCSSKQSSRAMHTKYVKIINRWRSQRGRPRERRRTRPACQRQRHIHGLLAPSNHAHDAVRARHLYRGTFPVGHLHRTGAAVQIVLRLQSGKDNF